jgi:hypothetical protein
MVLENPDDTVSEEITKLKYRLKEMSSAMDSQMQLLRLIVQVNLKVIILIKMNIYRSVLNHEYNILQKMEIKTEADEVDEGVSPKSVPGYNNKWTSPRLRNKLRTALSFSKAQPPK